MMRSLISILRQNNYHFSEPVNCQEARPVTGPLPVKQFTATLAKRVYK